MIGIIASNESGYTAPKYGTLEANRLQSQKAYDLINSVSARFGCSITWNSQARFNCIHRQDGKKSLFFKFHGNKFAPIVEFLSEDIELLEQIKQSFPSLFEMHDVEIKEGLL